MKYWPLFIALAVVGCASVQRTIELREPAAALPPAVDRTTSGGASHEPQAWGYLGSDSIVYYRSVSESRGMEKGSVTYRREAHHVTGQGVRIGGYTTASGEHVSFAGWAKREGDSLRFEPRPSRGMEAKQRRGRFQLPVADVRSVDAWLSDRTQTGVEIGVGTLVVAGLLVAAAFGIWIAF
jgi:hypothetical protein